MFDLFPIWIALLGCGASGSANLSPDDTGAADTGAADTNAADTGAADTGAADTDAADTGADDTGDPLAAKISPQINEFLAFNVGGETDGTGAYEDWVELYNPGDADLSLDGWWLTDDLDDPWKEPLDASLVIPAGGWLLLWADGDSDEGPDHLGFKLSADGEALGLFDPDGVAADAFSFPAQVEDVSAARFPDGGGWSLTAEPTPGASNGEAP